MIEFVSTYSSLILILLLLSIAVLVVFAYLFFREKKQKEDLEINLYMFSQGDVESDYSDYVELQEIKEEKLQVLTRLNRLSENDYDLEFDDDNQSPFDQALKRLIDSLTATKKREEIEKWTQTGLAHFAEVLRSKSDIEELASHLLGEIVRYIHGNQAAIFLTKPLSDEDRNKHHDLKGDEKLVLTGAYAFDREKYIEMEIMPGEGLVGQTFLEGKMLNFQNVPQNYVTISSGLGDAQPDNLIIMPLATNNNILGVMEIASFQVFNEHEIEFLKTLSETIATTLDVVKINSRTKQLLAKSTEDAKLLKSKENEMEAMIAELNDGKREMEQNQHRIVEMKEEAEKKSKLAEDSAERFQLILDSIDDGVYELTSFKNIRTAKLAVSEKFNQLIDSEDHSKLKTSLKKVISSLKIEYRNQLIDQLARVADGSKNRFALEVQFGFDDNYYLWTCMSLKVGNTVQRIAGTLSSLKDKTDKEKEVKEKELTNRTYNMKSKSVSVLVKSTGEISDKNIYAEALLLGNNDVLVSALFDVDIKKSESISIPVYKDHALGNNQIISNAMLGVDYSLDYRSLEGGSFVIDVEIEKVSNYGLLYSKVLHDVKKNIEGLQQSVDTYLLGLTKKIFAFKGQVEELYKSESIDEVKKAILKNVLDDFNHIIMALQYHDRVTQKLEHVMLQVGDYEKLVVTDGLTPEDERLGLFAMICNNNQQQLELIKMELSEALGNSYKGLQKVWSNDELNSMVRLDYFNFHDMWGGIESTIDRIVGFLSFMKYHSPKTNVDFENFRDEIIKYRNVFTMESERVVYDKVFNVIDFESIPEEESNEDEDGLELF